MGAILLLWCPQLLRLTGADAAVAVYATRYLRIRALALPAVLLVQVGVGWRRSGGEAGGWKGRRRQLLTS